MPTGRMPVMFSSVSAERSIRSRSASSGSTELQLVDPAVDADLVALGDHAPLLVGMEQRRHGRHVEASP